MAPVSLGNVYIVPGISFTSRRECLKTKQFSHVPCTRPTFFSQTFLFSRSFPVGFFGTCGHAAILKHQSRIQSMSIGSDIAVEDPNSAVVGDDEVEETAPPDDSPVSAEENEVSTAKEVSGTKAAASKRSRNFRKSEMPPVKDEELVPGATFTGKVRSIQPFGAFIDFGAFTDGLVHISRLSDSFVKDVNAVVSVGQEVKVRIVEVNTETGRISLTMREKDDASKMRQQKEGNAGRATDAQTSGDKPRQTRKGSIKPRQKRDETQKTSKFYKGQVLDGVVKNLNRSGAFVSLPEGEEGFLPISEESDGFASLLGDSQLQVGQEVNVRVLRINRGQVTLTMKKEENIEDINIKLNEGGVVHVATNPFELAFRKNKVISAFLDDRERMPKIVDTSTDSKVSEQVAIIEDQEGENVQISSEEKEDGTSISEADAAALLEDASASDSALASVDSSVTDDGNLESMPAEAELVEEFINSDQYRAESPEDAGPLEDESTSVIGSAGEEPESVASDSSVNVLSSSGEEELNESKDGASFAVDKDVSATSVSEDIPAAPVEAQKEETQTGLSEGEKESFAQVPDEAKTEDKLTITAENNELSGEAPTVPEANLPSVVPSDENEVPSSAISTPFETGPSEGKATVSAALVKQLREETGAGMMDCKKALAETGGDIVKAQEFLRKKGLASAEKKASRATAEGRIGSYIHDNRIGVMIEVNCETDFVARGDIFKQLVEDLAMQVAACPQVQHLVTDDVPEDIVNKEREIEMQKDDILQKPEQIRSKIVDGRIKKRLEELALLEQPFIKNDKVVVKDLIKQTISAIGENIKVTRFVRYNLGEGLEKKSQDFAAEVAAQTAAKEPAASQAPQPAPDTTEATERPPKVTISATLVKQLREETGAGMMDCKKALAETDGNLEKAQEYLRKKGLSSAEKKSGRLAAEGRIASYIHDSRIGVLIEVNCETDFVARGEIFKQLVDDLAMQVAACPQVEYISVEDIPESITRKERELELQREDLQSKPENIREKIVDGRVSKRLAELTLLEQPFIRDDSLLIKDLVKQTVATLGENIRVRRFVRYTLGEKESNEPNNDA
ncbi:polyprotein of EF-Ts, chloroplastic [Nymphaea colorata]|nr:polyprotein of EF-Ts, chloroplastic [Nymphaea colorata]